MHYVCMVNGTMAAAHYGLTVYAKDDLLPWAMGYSGASVPHQKMASLVEEMHFKLSGFLSSCQIFFSNPVT